MGKGSSSGPTRTQIKEASVYPPLIDPIAGAITDARKLYEQGYNVRGLNQRQQAGISSIDQAAGRVGGAIDEPLEYSTYLGGGRGVGGAPGQGFLQGIYQGGAPTAGYGTQENILANLMGGPGAGFAQQQALANRLGQGYGAGFNPTQNILGQAMGADNLDYIRRTAAGQNLQGNPQLEAVLRDVNRGTTQAYQGAISGLEGQMSRAGQTGGSVESQLRAKENEGLARALAANEAGVRYGDYATQRGYQQQAGMALPGAYGQQAATQLGAAQQLGGMENQRLGMQQAAAGQLGQMEANRIAQQQGAAGQLSDMAYQRLQAEMAAAQAAGGGYRQDVGQALQAGGMMPALGQAQFMPGQQLLQTGEFTRAAGERMANQPWENFDRYIQSLRGVQSMTGGGVGLAPQGPGGGQQAFQNVLGAAGLGAQIYGMMPAAAAVAPVSDRRLKRDIELVGHAEIPIYRWRYVWSDQVYEGPMAQDLAKVAPELVSVGADGYLRIPAFMVREVPDVS